MGQRFFDPLPRPKAEVCVISLYRYARDRAGRTALDNEDGQHSDVIVRRSGPETSVRLGSRYRAYV
jgi:hypothetical protein